MEKEIEEKFKKAVVELKGVKMTALESENILKNILNSPAQITQGKPSPYFFSFISKIETRKFVYIMTPCLIVFILGGTALASQGSLPGNILYPLKVRVIEPAYLSIQSTPLKRATYASFLVDKRLTEAETLAKEDKLDESKEEELSSLLKVHTNTIDLAINESENNTNNNLKENESVNEEIVSKFETNVDAHAQVLNSLQVKNISLFKFESESSIAGQNENQDFGKNKISEAAKEGALKLRENLEKKEGKKIPEEIKEVNKEESVPISQTSQNTPTKNTNSDTTNSDTTDKALEEAQKILDEYDLKDLDPGN